MRHSSILEFAQKGSKMATNSKETYRLKPIAPPQWTVNHGNSTSFYYCDPDGNEVETMLDNFSASETRDYKRLYQFTDEFGEMSEGNLDPDKIVDLNEAGVPYSILLDREQVLAMARDGEL
ncbi:MAG TPA: hypothetical protein DEV64_09900 [Rhodospirillaceae bacterium]|nr:hypothetical protein [Rhodospirillaceae bacterium]|tara:strand:- start:330 stop:692 length:363 start_codon:yes stop_codon:yes gene_type:complete